MNWYWENRGEGEFVPPNITTLLHGWDPAKGLLKSDLPQNAEVFIRELVQNFVDASNDWPTLKRMGIPKLTFRFLEFQGESARKLVQDLNLRDISERFSELSETNVLSMRFPKSDVLQGNLATVKLLVVTEENTSGMYGPWRRGDEEHDEAGRLIKNKMRDALLATARDSSSAGKGLGSFGEGKKALIGMSKCRTILAHTAFDPNLSNDGASSRFMGGVYWQNFASSGRKFTGFAMLGAPVEHGAPRPEPLKNSEAEALVDKLGIPGLERRLENVNLRTGTTLVFIEPDLEPRQCAEAIERNWWPLLDRGLANFEVFDWDGSLVSWPNDGAIEVFRSILASDEVVEVSDWLTATSPALRQHSLATPNIKQAGVLKLALDLRPGVGFSQQEPDVNWSMVAMIRNGMIINYQQYPRAERDHIPFARGVFEVSEEAHAQSEQLLRMSEPPLHNKWIDDRKQVDADVAIHASQVKSAIGDYVKAFRDEYLKSIPSQELNLEMFQEAFALSSKQGKRKPSKGAQKSEFELVDLSSKLEDLGGNYRRGIAARYIRLSQLGQSQTDKALVRLRVGWEVLQDGSWVDFGPFEVEQMRVWPQDFTVIGPGEFLGFVDGTKKIFEWMSRPYSELWTLRPFMEVLSESSIDDEKSEVEVD